MTDKHTPGPWSISDCRPVEIVGQLIPVGVEGEDASRVIPTAWVPAWEEDEAPTQAEALANARLIAAAPELLASVIELLAPLERASASLVEHGRAADENAEAAFDRAHAAIAKATGAA